MTVVVLSMQLILSMGLVYRTIESQSIPFFINIKIIHTEGLLWQFQRVIEQVAEFPLCRDIPVTECEHFQFRSHCQSRVLHRVGSVQGGTFRRHFETIRAWWPCVLYGDTTKEYETKFIIGQTAAKDEESSVGCRRCHQSLSCREVERRADH